jgi:phenylpropionate dioxygenase-like ring-hydroxylating dioxygenase large terminal subunit
MSTSDISVDRYFSQAWHDEEVDRVWRRVWQMACHADEIRDVGQHVVYEIGDESLIVVRTGDAPDDVRAYVNSCLHRGTQLRTEGGTVSRFRCPFHGFVWDLDGKLTDVPNEWDFEHIAPDEFCLPEARVGLWGGYVFIRLDPATEPLESYLEVLPDEFAAFPLDDRWKAVHVAKVMPCNWKLALEAFIESYHIGVTHPQTAAYVADANTQYDIFPGSRHVSRMITLEGVPSPNLGSVPPAETTRKMQRDLPFYSGEPIIPGDGDSVRELLAERGRQKMSASTGADLTQLSTSECLDAIEYFLFPNFVPWGGHGAPICYRFRPYGNDPSMSIMEIMLLFARPDSGQQPRPARITWLDVDQPWSDAPELGAAATVIQQDCDNLMRLQRGLRASHKPGVTLGNYQEARIRHFHETLENYLSETPVDFS